MSRKSTPPTSGKHCVPSVLLDTGPIVALFKRNDSHHARAVAWFKDHRGSLLTTHAVVTEAWHLVSKPARIPLVRFIAATCDVLEFGPNGQSRIIATLERFSDLSMDYADATLVILADIQRVTKIATIDINDFTSYRLANGKSFQLAF